MLSTMQQRPTPSEGQNSSPLPRPTLGRVRQILPAPPRATCDLEVCTTLCLNPNQNQSAHRSHSCHPYIFLPFPSSHIHKPAVVPLASYHKLSSPPAKRTVQPIPLPSPADNDASQPLGSSTLPLVSLACLACLSAPLYRLAGRRS